MIFIDTNVIVAAIGRADADLNLDQEAEARELIIALSIPTRAAFTSEAVIVETANALRSRFGSDLGTFEAARALGPIIDLPGLRIASKHIYSRALSIWADRPGLGFVDALTLACAEQGDIQLATFDRQLLRSPGVTPYWREADAAL